MNFVLLVLLLVMIAFTIYNFSKDIRNSINTGKPIVEGMNSSQNATTDTKNSLEDNPSINQPAVYMGVKGGYDFSSPEEAGAKCKELGLQLCKKEEVIAGAKSNDTLQNQCSSGWTTDAPRGWYSVKGAKWCGSDNTWNTYAPPSGKGSAHCCIDSEKLKGRCGPLFNEQKCPPGGYCNEANGWCGITDAHKNAQESTKYDGEMIDNNGDNKLTQSNGFEDKRPAPEEPNWFSDEVSDSFIQLENSVDENGVIMTKNTGVCPHNCKASEFANSSCVDEIFEGKEYKKCKWTKDGKNDSQCDKCGAVLIPKNEFGFARTDAENTSSQKVDKITKQDFYNEGKYFIGKVAENNGIKLPSDIENKHYIETGKILYKYKYSRTTEVTSYLHKYVKALLSPSSFKNEDRGGGSNSAYTLNYKPVDPRISPKPYDSFWHVF